MTVTASPSRLTNAIARLTKLSNDARWFEQAMFVEIFLACAVAFSANTADPDLWGHVQYGRDGLRDGLARTCTYSYAADGYRWINHENLAEYTFAFLVDTVGSLGLMWLKCLMGLTIVGFFFRQIARRQVGLVATCVAALLLALSLSNHWAIRPQIFTYFFYGLIIALLTYCFEGWSDRWNLPSIGQRFSQETTPPDYSVTRLNWLWLAVPIMVLATNAHGGFIAIYCVFAAYLGIRSLEALYCTGGKAWPIVGRFVAIVIASGFATLVNPYGYHLHTWLYMDLSIPRPEILEWHRPDFGSSYAAPLLLLVVTCVGCLLYSQKKHDATQLVVLACCFWQTLEHLRHIPFFAIPFAMWFAPHIESVLQYFGMSRGDEPFGSGMSRFVRGAFVAGIIVASLLVGGKLARQMTDVTVAQDEYPIAAVKYIKEQKFEGKLVCTFNWAQYALAALGPTSQLDPTQCHEPVLLIHSDGRLRTSYPQELLDMQFDFILGDYPGMRNRSPLSPPVDGARILDYLHPDLVLIDRGQEPSVQVMKAHAAEWTLLYQDALSQLWGRSSKYDDPVSPNYVPAAARQITETPQVGKVSWPAIPLAEYRPPVKDRQ